MQFLIRARNEMLTCHGYIDNPLITLLGKTRSSPIVRRTMRPLRKWSGQMAETAPKRRRESVCATSLTDRARACPVQRLRHKLWWCARKSCSRPALTINRRARKSRFFTGRERARVRWRWPIFLFRPHTNTKRVIDYFLCNSAAQRAC